jgi:predicted NBD/HSP70 family sugar kinase
MRIAQVAPLAESVPPKLYGGTERVISWLTEELVNGLISAAEKKRLKLAPFIGIGCPGFIEEDGSIDRGAQNLPGNWESSRFNLPVALHDMIPAIGEHETSIVLHNDAVVQGLSEIPFMQEVAHWGVLTIGTGLGNARFTNRDAVNDQK